VGYFKDSSSLRQNFVLADAGVPLERGRQTGVLTLKTLFCRYRLI